MTTMTNSITKPASKPTSKPSWQSKTLWFNVISILAMVLAMPELANMGLDPKMLAVIIGGLNIILRFLTNGPVSLTGNHANATQ